MVNGYYFVLLVPFLTIKLKKKNAWSGIKFTLNILKKILNILNKLTGVIECKQY